MMFLLSLVLLPKIIMINATGKDDQTSNTTKEIVYTIQILRNTIYKIQTITLDKPNTRVTVFLSRLNSTNEEKLNETDKKNCDDNDKITEYYLKMRKIVESIKNIYECTPGTKKRGTAIAIEMSNDKLNTLTSYCIFVQFGQTIIGFIYILYGFYYIYKIVLHEIVLII